MASIIDPTIEVAGNPADALKAAEQSTTPSTTQQASQATGVQIPDRFKGKTNEEMYQIYANLERHAGKLANDLGQSNNRLDQLLSMKRENDLRANGAQTVTPAQTAVTASDLLENPTQALDRYFETKESTVVNELKQRIAAQEAAMAQTSFVSRHPDWQTHTNDPAFVDWARQTPWRSNLAAAAAKNDLAAADALLTEFKAYQPLLKRSTEGTALEAARRVGLERSASSGDTAAQATGPIIRRRDNMALRISDPDKYESPAYQTALLSAIKDGRYKD